MRKDRIHIARIYSDGVEEQYVLGLEKLWVNDPGFMCWVVYWYPVKDGLVDYSSPAYNTILRVFANWAKGEFVPLNARKALLAADRERSGVCLRDTWRTRSTLSRRNC